MENGEGGFFPLHRFVFMQVLKKLILVLALGMPFIDPTMGSESPMRVLLMTSLPTTSNFMLRIRARNGVEERLEKIIHRELDSGEDEITVLHHVDQEVLFREIHSSRYDAVFWVSHSAQGSTGPDGISAMPEILDQSKVDVRIIFEALNPRIQFLGVVSCKSNQVIQQFKASFLSGSNRLVEGFDHKVDVFKGLRNMLKRYKATSRSIPSSQSEPVEWKGLPLRMTRSLDAPAENYPSLRIRTRNHLLGVFPKGRRGKVQTLDLRFPSDLRMSEKSAFKVIVETGASPDDSPIEAFGEVKVTADWGEWDLFSDSDGIPIGVSSRIFRLK